MAELKTRPTDDSVEVFLRGIEDPLCQKDCRTVLALMKKATRSDAKMWGGSIIGFGSYHYKYESGREGDTFVLGFSPRKAALTLYLCAGLERHMKLLARLGKHKIGKGCLYIKKLEDVEQSVLDTLLTAVAAEHKAAASNRPARA